MSNDDTILPSQLIDERSFRCAILNKLQCMCSQLEDAVIYSSPVVVVESVETCSRLIKFTTGGGDLIHDLYLPDRRRVTHTAHGFGIAGEIVPLKPGSIAGTYELAQANDPNNVATHIAAIVDVNRYDLMSHGFFTFPSHGYALGQHYAVSAVAPGGFVLTSGTLPEQYLQNSFFVETANCLFLNLEEAQPPSGALGTGPSTSLTIASGAITVTGSYHKIDTESLAATDDLVNIYGGIDGALVVLRSTNVARDITIKNGTGNIRTAGLVEFTLDYLEDRIMLQYDGDLMVWVELSRSDNVV